MINSAVVNNILSDINRVFQTHKELQLKLDVKNFAYEFFSKDYYSSISISCNSTRKYPQGDLSNKDAIAFENGVAGDIMTLEAAIAELLNKKYTNLRLVVILTPVL